MNVEIVVLICQKCSQCLSSHKCLGLFFEGVLYVIVIVILILNVYFGQVMTPHHSDQMSHVSRMALLGFSLHELVIVFVIVIVFSIVFFVGQVMSPHHSDPMSQWSQVSIFAL